MPLIFDLDDTLLDDRKTKAYYLPKLYEAYTNDIGYSFEKFSEMWNQAIPKYYSLYTQGELTFEEQRHLRIKDSFGNQSLDSDLITEILEKFDLFFKESWSLFDDFQTIETLMQSTKTGLITNGSSKQQNEKIDRLGIRSFFDVIIISEEVGCSKPCKEIFEMATLKLGCPIESCFYVGDNFELDVIGSYNAGMKPIWINRYGEQNRTSFTEYHEISSLNELLGIL